METEVFTKKGITYTRFKIPNKQLNIYKRLVSRYTDTSNPSKVSSRYTYYEVEGDMLNHPREVQDAK